MPTFAIGQDRLNEASRFATEHRGIIEQAFFDKKTKQQVIDMLTCQFGQGEVAECHAVPPRIMRK